MVCLYIGGICLCKWMAGIERGSPHSSLLKHFQDRQKALPILCSASYGLSEGGIYPGIWFLGSNPAQRTLARSLPLSLPLLLPLLLPLSASLSHTYSPGQWLYFNMVMIRDGGSGKGGEGAHIYSRGIWGGGAI